MNPATVEVAGEVAVPPPKNVDSADTALTPEAVTPITPISPGTPAFAKANDMLLDPLASNKQAATAKDNDKVDPASSSSAPGNTNAAPDEVKKLKEKEGCLNPPGSEAPLSASLEAHPSASMVCSGLNTTGSTRPSTGEQRLDGSPSMSLQNQVKQLLHSNSYDSNIQCAASDTPKRVVSVAIRISLITDIDPIKSSFMCRFRIYLEWLDNAAVGAATGKAQKDVASKISIPEITVMNAIDCQCKDKTSSPWVVDGESGHVACSMEYKAIIQVTYDMSFFPFDSQWLTIGILMKNKKDRDRTFHFQFSEVDELRGLDEWQANSTMHETKLSDKGPCMNFSVLVQRLSRYYIVNVLLMLCVCSSLTFSLYVIDLEQYAERAKIFMGLSLTLVTFRLTVEKQLPKVSYSTLFDQYALSCQGLLIIIAVGATICCEMGKTNMEDAKFFEGIMCVAFAAIWILWNTRFAAKAWTVKKLQERDSEEGAASLLGYSGARSTDSLSSSNISGAHSHLNMTAPAATKAPVATKEVFLTPASVGS